MTNTIVSSGQTSSGLTLNSGDFLTVLAGGTANATDVNSGTDNVFGTVSGTVIHAGQEFVSSGGRASGTVVSFGGAQILLAGGLTTGTVISGGFEGVSGGVASGTIISFGGMAVSSGGTASGATIGSGGVLQVFAGGAASATTISAGGLQYVFSGGIDAGGTILGQRQVWAGGVASGTQIGAGGIDYVYGAASNTTIGSGGSEIVQSGGTLSGAIVNGGFLEISSGAHASGGVAFTALGGTVRLDDSQHLDAGLIISGLTPTAGAIDFGDIGFTSGATSAAWTQAGTSGTLTLTSGALQASVTLFGSYLAANFKMQSDGNGGTLGECQEYCVREFRG